MNRFPLRRSGEKDVHNIRENGCDNLYFRSKIDIVKLQTKRVEILTVITGFILIFNICGCRVLDKAKIATDRQYMRSRPLMDGEVKRLRQMSYWDFSWVSCARFSPDGKYIVASFDNKIALWDVTSGAQIRSFEGHKSNVWDVIFSPDMKYLASCSVDDKTVRLWDFSSGNEIRRFPEVQGHPSRVCFSADGSQLAAATLDTIFVWETDNGRLIHRFTDYGYYSAVTFSPDGKFLNAMGRDSIFCTWNLQTGALTNSLIHPKESLFSPALARSADGSRLAIGEQQIISVWDTVTGQLINSWRPYAAVNGWAIAISSDGRMAVHASRFITIWNVETGEEIWKRQMPCEVQSANFSPDNKFLVTGAEDGSIRIWKAPTVSQ
jgi:WD40 repeat protein